MTLFQIKDKDNFLNNCRIFSKIEYQIGRTKKIIEWFKITPSLKYYDMDDNYQNHYPLRLSSFFGHPYFREHLNCLHFSIIKHFIVNKIS